MPPALQPEPSVVFTKRSTVAEGVVLRVVYVIETILPASTVVLLAGAEKLKLIEGGVETSISVLAYAFL
jgi:hypothetical protein